MQLNLCGAPPEHVTQLIIFFSSSHSFLCQCPRRGHTTIHHNTMTTPRQQTKGMQRNTELTSNIPPLFDKADEDLARRSDQKLHAAAHVVRRFMQMHGAAMTTWSSLSRRSGRRAATESTWHSLGPIGQFNKSFESLTRAVTCGSIICEVMLPAGRVRSHVGVSIGP